MRYQTTHEIYQFLWDYYQEHGFAPTYREIAESCFIAHTGVASHLDRLTRWGWITREEGKARSMRPLQDPTTVLTPENPQKN
ncbi:MAG: hypothetical protein LCI00_19310 [Chloroflexi bacterium]|nr:hypothetical protein [Chloroflexota bacterium]MCC6891450.1 hypothetical protein [Anaerolineae bacterium]